jgi:prevent-host-death family protein
MGATDDTVQKRRATRDTPVDQRSGVAKVGIRELGRNPSRVIAHLAEFGEPVIITDRGRPVAVITPIDETEVEDFILTHAKEFIADRKTADLGLPIGRTHSLPDVLAELDD